jgi:hypothetical protein
LFGHKIKKNEMGRACGTYGTEEKKMHTEILWGNLKEGDDLEDLGINERKILKWILNARACAIMASFLIVQVYKFLRGKVASVSCVQ